MNDLPVRCLRRAVLLLLAALAPLFCSCVALAPRVEDACEGDCKWKARVCKDPSVMTLAHDLDELEEHIDKYGSVVAKQPDVWGQARLQMHREQVEKILADRLDKFQETLQGSLSRSDQAYLADALALSAAVSSGTAGAAPPRVAVNNNTANSAAATPVPVPAATPQTEVFAGFGNISRTGVQGPLNIPFAVAKTGLSLEPTELLDQLNRYLQHLNELRRINEGDDTADSPGYSLNLVRIPVSVLPGKKTYQGYGAEVTMTLTPYLSDELLPTTFRNLVVNDLVDQLGLPLTEALNDCEARCFLEHWNKQFETPCPTSAKVMNPPPPTPEKFTAFVRSIVNKRYVIPATKLRQGKLPFPPSETYDVFGDDFVSWSALEAYQTFKDDLGSKPVIHLPDVQGYLLEELAAAYKLLADPGNQDLWNECTPDLVVAIRARNKTRIEEARGRFTDAVQAKQGGAVERRTHVALAWAIVVESALLNDQLIRDMKETASLKGCACLSDDSGQEFFRPAPTAEARRAFNEYIRCRWPIHVFALDPVSQEQNIADAFSLRREMQLALSLAFASGQLSANNMLRYARRIEEDIDTIALNRTAVGFSHGEDTFGWRFYPRFQTPEIGSNAEVIFRDLLVGGPSRNAQLCERRLEPGMRECTAVVIMPSFVPYCTLEVNSNWFRLTDPKCKELTTAQAMRLSRSVKAIQTCGCNVGDADCYRDGDLARLMSKAQQLEARLPLQSTMVQVPYENTLGGFAMFNNGVTDLAPALTGWYGATYINTDAPTTLFLVGNHFSVHQTRVIAGGVEISDHEMLSRQVMKVTIPAGAQTVPAPEFIDGKCVPDASSVVDVHLATPYGVTSHLFIPAVGQKPAKADVGLSWGNNGMVDLGYVYSGVGIAASNPPTTRPAFLRVKGKDPALSGAIAITLLFSDKVGVDLPAPITFDASGAATVQGADLAAVFTKFGPVYGPQQTNPPQPVSVDSVIVQPLVLDQITKAYVKHGEARQLKTNLTINWVLAPK
jgi:hypothetical protein